MSKPEIKSTPTETAKKEQTTSPQQQAAMQKNAAQLGLGLGAQVYEVGKVDATLTAEVQALAGGAYQTQLLQGAALWSRPASSRPALVKRLLQLAEAKGLELVCVRALKGGATGVAYVDVTGDRPRLAWCSLKDEPRVVGTADIAVIRQVRGK